MENWFCIKTNQDFQGNECDVLWPSGEYCVYKYGQDCALGKKILPIYWQAYWSRVSYKLRHGGRTTRANQLKILKPFKSSFASSL